MNRSLASGLTLAALLGMGGCSGTDANAGPSMTGSYSFAVTTTSIGLVPGSSGAVVVQLVRSAFTAPITVTAVDVPSGVHVTIPAASFAGDTIAATIAVDASTASGSYPFHLHASAAGVSDIDLAVSVMVGPLAEYVLTVNPSPLQVHNGSSVQGTVVITRYPGFTGAVTLVMDPTLGITADLPSTPVTGDTAVMVVHTPTTLQVGTAYLFHIRGVVPNTLDGSGFGTVLVTGP